MPSGLTSISSGSMGARRMLAVSFEKASLESPWKEFVQSTWRAPSSRMRGWSFRPLVRSDISGNGGCGSEVGGDAVVMELYDGRDGAGVLVTYCACCAR